MVLHRWGGFAFLYLVGFPTLNFQAIRKVVLTALSLYNLSRKAYPTPFTQALQLPCNTEHTWTKYFIPTSENSLPDSKCILQCLILNFHILGKNTVFHIALVFR